MNWFDRRLIWVYPVYNWIPWGKMQSVVFSTYQRWSNGELRQWEAILLGQAIVLFFISIFAYIFLFAGRKTFYQVQFSQTAKLAWKARNISNVFSSPSIFIAKNIGIDVQTDKRESCEWLNVLLGQACLSYLKSEHFYEYAVKAIESQLNGSDLPSFISPIILTEFTLKDRIPTLSEARIANVTRPDGSTSLRAEINMKYEGNISFGIETAFVIKWPKAEMASLPAQLNISIPSISGTLCFEVANDRTYVYFLDDLRINFEIKSTLGHRSKLRDVPKISSIIISKLQSILRERCVEPNKLSASLPFLQLDLLKARVDQDASKEPSHLFDPSIGNTSHIATDANPKRSSSHISFTFSPSSR